MWYARRSDGGMLSKRLGEYALAKWILTALEKTELAGIARSRVIHF